MYERPNCLLLHVFLPKICKVVSLLVCRYDVLHLGLPHLVVLERHFQSPLSGHSVTELPDGRLPYEELALRTFQDTKCHASAAAYGVGS
jgi:hypothetical protein